MASTATSSVAGTTTLSCSCFPTSLVFASQTRASSATNWRTAGSWSSCPTCLRATRWTLAFPARVRVSPPGASCTTRRRRRRSVPRCSNTWKTTSVLAWGSRVWVTVSGAGTAPWPTPPAECGAQSSPPPRSSNKRRLPGSRRRRSGCAQRRTGPFRGRKRPWRRGV